MERLSLLVTDLDGTLLGDDAALAEFARSYEQLRDGLRLAYSSGRFGASIRESIATSALPEPDAIIGGVGTEIRDYKTDASVPGWPKCDGSWNSDAVRTVCASFSQLEEQPQQFVSLHKVSYFGHDLDEAFLADLAARLAEAGQCTTIVYSSHRDLDILPGDTNKGAAAAYLAAHLGVSPDRVIVAGDTGNDLAMFEQGFRGIVVGNALPELKALGGPRVYHAEGRFAAGVLEGLRHWLGSDETLSAATGGRSTPDRDAGRDTRG